MRGGMLGSVPFMPLHRWGSVLQLTTLPFPTAARASPFLPEARQWATSTGHGHEEHARYFFRVLGSIPVIYVLTFRVIPP